ncbi:hypothetical protein Scep_026435 [Stephania cephalantha]|uniref:Uncharacterized protein n=1 Tax=Stephania cephalantha TaxID=152367 RepID=A0AAP0HSI8_9MAGN
MKKQNSGLWSFMQEFKEKKDKRRERMRGRFQLLDNSNLARHGFSDITKPT